MNNKKGNKCLKKKNTLYRDFIRLRTNETENRYKKSST